MNSLDRYKIHYEDLHPEIRQRAMRRLRAKKKRKDVKNSK